MPTFLTPEPIIIEVRNASGEILLDLSDTSATTVDVVERPGHPLAFVDEMVRAFGGRNRGRRGDDEGASVVDSTEAVRVEHRDADGGGTLIIDTDPNGGFSRSSYSVRISAPSGSSLRAKAQSANVVVTGSLDRAEIRTASGDIRLADVASDALAHTASGDVAVTSAQADLDVRTASGDIELGSVAGVTTAHTTSGDIRLGSGGSDIKARSVSGDVRIGEASTGVTTITSVTGDVEVGIRRGSVASLDLMTLTGQTKSDFEVSDESPVEDGPILQIKIKTTSGDIRLERAAVETAV